MTESDAKARAVRRLHRELAREARRSCLHPDDCADVIAAFLVGWCGGTREAKRCLEGVTSRLIEAALSSGKEAN